MQTTETATTNAFDFDSAEHKSYDKVPGAKVINDSRGIWIAHENQQLAGWIEGKEMEGATSYQQPTAKFDVQGDKIKIAGALFKQPRLLVIGRSPLLKTMEKKIEGLFIKGDKEKGYGAARKYMVVFLDTQNQPLHITPIQLTARGSFQINFDQQLLKFRSSLQEAYAKGLKKPIEGKSELWHSMGIFCPDFKTEMRGTAPNQSAACITVGYQMPTPENWESLCIGRQAIAQDIAALHNSVKDWWKKGLVESEPEPVEVTQPEISEEEAHSSLFPPALKNSFDFYMMESERLMKELGWQVATERKFIKERYGKASRQLLTEKELLDFVNYLEKQTANTLDTFDGKDDFPPY